MGRMVFRIIPRDGKPGEWFGEAAKYDPFAPGRYEMFIDDYATDVCEGETQTARSTWCEDASSLLVIFTSTKKYRLKENCTLGEIQRKMAAFITDMDKFTAYCDKHHISYEKQPLWVDTDSFNEYTGEHRGNYTPFRKD